MSKNCPAQSGSSDPSPEDIRPIGGFTEIKVSHSGADTSNQTAYTVSLGEVDKVYYGTLDVTTGTLTIDAARRSRPSKKQKGK